MFTPAVASLSVDLGEPTRLVHHVNDDRRTFEVVVAEPSQDLAGLVLLAPSS